MPSDLKSTTAPSNGIERTCHPPRKSPLLPQQPSSRPRRRVDDRRRRISLPIHMFLADYLFDFQPQTEVEADLVEVMAISRWRLRRLLEIEADPEDRLAFVFKKLSDNSTSLALLLRYEANINRSYDRALKQLLHLRSKQVGQVPDLPSPKIPNEPNGLSEPRPQGSISPEAKQVPSPSIPITKIPNEPNGLSEPRPQGAVSPEAKQVPHLLFQSQKYQTNPTVFQSRDHRDRSARSKASPLTFSSNHKNTKRTQRPFRAATTGSGQPRSKASPPTFRSNHPRRDLSLWSRLCRDSQESGGSAWRAHKNAIEPRSLRSTDLQRTAHNPAASRRSNQWNPLESSRTGSFQLPENALRRGR